MLRIGICDDQAQARLLLRSALERILDEQNVQAQCFEFSSGETLLQWYERHAGELDLLFLDMELHALDGMETARRLRAVDQELPGNSWNRSLRGPRPPWCGSWARLLYAAMGKLTTASRWGKFCILHLTGGRCSV